MFGRGEHLKGKACKLLCTFRNGPVLPTFRPELVPHLKTKDRQEPKRQEQYA